MDSATAAKDAVGDKLDKDQHDAKANASNPLGSSDQGNTN